MSVRILHQNSQNLLIKKDTTKLNRQTFLIGHMLVAVGESLKFCSANVDLNRPKCVSTLFKFQSRVAWGPILT